MDFSLGRSNLFIGHYGVALAAKKLEPKISLGWLFAASQFVDILWTLFVLAGIEQVEIHAGHMEATPLNFVSYPYSHSLLMAVVWGALVYALVYALPIFKSLRGTKAALIMGAVTVSHWFLDLPVHAPDLPLALGDSPKVGFGLWNSMAATIALESLLLLGGLWIYARTTKADGKRGRYGIYLLCGMLLSVFVMTTMSQEPPPSPTVLAGSGFFMYIVICSLAGWLDKRRVALKTN